MAERKEARTVRYNILNCPNCGQSEAHAIHTVDVCQATVATKCLLCNGVQQKETLITRRDESGKAYSVCRPCFDDSMNGDFGGINVRRELSRVR